MPEYRLAYVRVFVTDFERAVRFYTESLGLKPGVRDDAAGWCQFETGEASLAIERVAADEEGGELVSRFVAVSLEVEDIGAAYKGTAREGRGVPWAA